LDRQVDILTFTRNPASFHKVLNEQPELHACCVEHQSGAKIFVLPSLTQTVLDTISFQNIDLRPHDVVASRRLQPLVLGAVQELPCNEKVKQKPETTELEVDRYKAAQAFYSNSGGSEALAMPVDDRFEVLVKRTFLQVEPVNDQARSGHTVSTTDYHLGSHKNPRLGKATLD